MKSYFRYIRGKHGNGIGAVFVRDNGKGEFEIGISICNPKDTFSKTKARKIATDYADMSEVYSFYDMIDGDWYADIVDELPHGSNIEDDVYSTICNIVHDITMDYARAYYKSIA